MKIIVREKADADLDHIFGWIAESNPTRNIVHGAQNRESGGLQT
jgi:hypothetical protein